MIRSQDRTAAGETGGTAARELGAMLREVRTSRGFSLRDAASSLRIRITYLEAIEAGRFKELPGPTYASGFLRAYATYLGVDGDDVMNRFKAALEGFSRPSSLVLPSPAETGHMPTGSVFLVAAIVAIVAYGGWYYLSVEGRDPGEFFAAMPQRIASLLSKEPTEDPAAPQPEAAPRDASPPAAIVHTPPPAQPAPPEAAPAQPAPPMAAAAPEPPPAVVAPRPSSPATPAPTPPSETAAVPSPAPSPATPDATPRTPARVVLRASADTWVELRAPGEAPVLSRVLRRGESYDVPARGDLVLATGNAGGLEIAIDGRSLPPLGASGAVQRGIALDPDKLAAVTR